MVVLHSTNSRTSQKKTARWLHEHSPARQMEATGAWVCAGSGGASVWGSEQGTEVGVESGCVRGGAGGGVCGGSVGADVYGENFGDDTRYAGRGGGGRGGDDHGRAKRCGADADDGFGGAVFGGGFDSGRLHSAGRGEWI